MAVEPEQAEAPNVETNKLSLSLFRRPDKFKIGEDFDLFIKKCNLYFEAVELEDVKKRRFALLFNLSEDAFRLAEPVEFGEGENAYKDWIGKLKSLFERNQTATEKRYNFHRREQEPGESVDSFAVSLREAGARCGFHGDEYSSRLVDQFILGLRDKATQNKLLQEPPNSLNDALLIARRFEAANATMKTLAREATEKLSRTTIGSVSSLNAVKTCYSCNGFGHVSRQCPTMNNFRQNNTARPQTKLCYSCQKPGHLAKYCPLANQQPVNTKLQGYDKNWQMDRHVTICYRCGNSGHIAKFLMPTSKKKTLMVETTINGKNKLCIVDTGASISLVSKDRWQPLKLDDTPLFPSDIVAEAANNSPIGILGKTTLNVQFDENNKSSHDFYVANEMVSEIILGLDCLVTNKVNVDMAEMVLKFPDGTTKPLCLFDSTIADTLGVVLDEDLVVPAKHEVFKTARVRNPTLNESILEPNMNLSGKGVLVARVIVQPKEQRVPIQIINPGTSPIKLCKGMTVGQLQQVGDELRDPTFINSKCGTPSAEDKIKFELEHLSGEEREKMENLLNKYQDVFAKNSSELGVTTLAEHKIETGDAVPVKQLPRRLPNSLRTVVEDQVEEMLENNIIKPSNSPWSSPIVLVRKKDGTWRFCIDFRKLNDVTVADLMDNLAGHQYFSTLDLASGYWQVPVDESSLEKTAFVIPGGGHFEFLRMPFGLTNAVPTFQRLMLAVLNGLLPLKSLVYLDDLLVVGRTFDQHLENLDDVLQAIDRAGLRLKLSKCSFAKPSVDFLGFTVSAAGLAPNVTKVGAIRAFPTPQNLTELRRFLGMASYYRRFISGFSDIAGPLHRLTQKGVRFDWDKNCQRAFEQLKEQLISAPVLAFPDLNGDYILYTDASDVGIGAVLTQKDENEEEKVVSFASKAFSGAEKNWTTTEKEAFAVVWALQYFHPYVYGRKVTIYTDHKALKWLRDIKHPNGKLARWILKLEEYDYTIEHLPNTKMQHADALSRAPVNTILVSMSTWQEFEVMQTFDEDIQLVDVSVTLDTLYKNFDSLVVKNHVLCRKWTDKTAKEREQIVVPTYLTPNILEEAHCQVGHLGVAKTFEMIQRKFYWPGFFKAVEEFCRNCEVCSKNKAVPRPRSPMKPIEVIPIPFYMIGVDIIGPLKTTSRGNKYILSVVDYYTKYAEAVALPNQEAVTVARALEDIFARHGMPSVLLTDQGSNFESKVIASLCEMFGIEKRRTTAYHPQTDGLCERFNGILKSLLRMRVNKEKNDWDEQLPHALLAYRVSTQSSTGVTPFEMLYGREVRLPFGTDQEKLVSSPTHGPAKYVEELKKRQDILRKLVTKRIEKAQEKQKRSYDLRYRAQQNKRFYMGDTVLLKNFRARGLDEKYTGPYIIVNIRENDCEIESLESRKRKVVNANNLRRFVVETVANPLGEESEDMLSSDSDESTIELINERAGVRLAPRGIDDQAEPLNLCYNLRQNRRQPDRYGVPVLDY
ncbi:Transposon Ty3-G Gag-Pol poly [Paramuricea clavata]|uniref:RNA-directed DNA polymerase n=1 Tax=Paramuricea clavata TaxID=317549 RepID=A0A6S7GBP5_PARCT|nr:Transposon Ty3-G Gag-Pol poly [Paramuricea clavata]